MIFFPFLFRSKTHNNCTGDGTVGWVLSAIRNVGFRGRAAVAVMPLGTGNDMSRYLNWGGKFSKKSVATIVSDIHGAKEITLDRWQLTATDFTPPSNEKISKLKEKEEEKEVEDEKKMEKEEEELNGKENEKETETEKEKQNGLSFLPPKFQFMNNYCGFGIDAHLALQLHLAREKLSAIFKSRLLNLAFYGAAAGWAFIRRTWTDFAKHVTVHCTNAENQQIDLTIKIKEKSFHGILLLNIPSYAGGTHPWNGEQLADDGLIEVVGITMMQLSFLQLGRHGTNLAQCKEVKIKTVKEMPMQVDGEAFKLKPCDMHVKYFEKEVMLSNPIIAN